MTGELEPIPGTTAHALGPVFVTGASRSGKTMMRWLLSSHSRLAVSRRTELWPRFFERFGDLSNQHNLERCLHAMLARKQIAALAPDGARLRRSLASGPPTYARLFGLLHEHYAAREGKPRWGDQSAGLELFAGDIMSAYPGCRFLHLVRDPRDCYDAMRHQRTRGPSAVGECAAEWVASASAARRNQRIYPGAYLIVPYEALVSDPARVMRQVCAFIGEQFEPAMLRIDGARRYDHLRGPDGIPVTAAYIGSYRGSVEAGDLAFIQALAGRHMRDLGYAPVPLQLGVRQRARLATREWPVGLARMASWRTRDALRRLPEGPLDRLAVAL